MRNIIFTFVAMIIFSPFAKASNSTEQLLTELKEKIRQSFALSEGENGPSVVTYAGEPSEKNKVLSGVDGAILAAAEQFSGVAAAIEAAVAAATEAAIQSTNNEMASAYAAEQNIETAYRYKDDAEMRCTTQEMARMMECETKHIDKCEAEEQKCLDNVVLDIGSIFYEEPRCAQQKRFCLEGTNPRGNAYNSPFTLRQMCDEAAGETFRIGMEAIDQCKVYSNMDASDLFILKQCADDICKED